MGVIPILLVVLLPLCLGAPNPSGCTDKDGEEVEVGEWYFPDADDPCKSCRCSVEYMMECTTIHCDAPNCPGDPIEGTCCGWTCKYATCTDRNGNEIQHGDRYKPNKDPCFECICNDGKSEMCVSPACIPAPRHPDCEKYEADDEECCKENCVKWKPMKQINETDGQKACTDRKGKKVQHGDMYRPYKDDPCKSCDCQNGKPSKYCATPMCRAPDYDPNCLEYEMDKDICCKMNCVKWKDSESKRAELIRRLLEELTE